MVLSDPIGSLKPADELHLDSTLPILLPVLFSAISARAFRLSCAVKLSMSFLGKNIKHQKWILGMLQWFRGPITNFEWFRMRHWKFHLKFRACHDINLPWQQPTPTHLYELDRQQLFAPRDLQKAHDLCRSKEQQDILKNVLTEVLGK